MHTWSGDVALSSHRAEVVKRCAPTHQQFENTAPTIYLLKIYKYKILQQSAIIAPGERTKKCNLHTYCTYSYTYIFIAMISRKHIYFCTNNAHLINIASFSPKKVKVTLFVQKYLSRGLISAIFWMCANKRNIHDWRLARHTTCILHSTFIIDTTECSSRREYMSSSQSQHTPDIAILLLDQRPLHWTDVSRTDAIKMFTN